MAVNCRFYDRPQERRERASVKAWRSLKKGKKDVMVVVWWGLKERYYQKEKGKWGCTETPAPPSALCLEGGPRAGLGNVRHEEGNKADYCPPERSLVLGRGGGHKKSATLCMNGWMADWLYGWMLGPSLAGWLACLPTEKACKRANQGRPWECKARYRNKADYCPLE